MACYCVRGGFSKIGQVSPTIEACHTLSFVLVRYGVRVECLVVRVLELRLGQFFVVVDRAIANELCLWHPRDGLEVRVKDRFLRFTGLIIAVTIRFGGGIECLCGSR